MYKERRLSGDMSEITEIRHVIGKLDCLPLNLSQPLSFNYSSLTRHVLGETGNPQFSHRYPRTERYSDNQAFQTWSSTCPWSEAHLFHEPERFQYVHRPTKMTKKKKPRTPANPARPAPCKTPIPQAPHWKIMWYYIYSDSPQRAVQSVFNFEVWSDFSYEKLELLLGSFRL